MARQFIIATPDNMVTFKDVDQDKLLEQLYSLLRCDCIEILRSNAIEAGASRRLIMIVGEFGALKENRQYNSYASSASGQVIYGSVAFAEEIDGPDGGEIVGLIPEDQARVLSYLITLQAFRIREPSAFMSQIVRSLIYAFRSTLPVDWNCEDLHESISQLIYDEYEQILHHLKEEAAAADPGTRHKEVKNDDK